MNYFVPAYDTECLDCLEGVRSIVKLHERFEVPATFFIVAQILEKQKAEYVALLKNHPLFEIGSHTYSHMLLFDTPRFGKAGPLDRYHLEIVESKKILEDTFETTVRGFRTPVGSPQGLCGHKTALPKITEAKYTYTSSAAWDIDYSLPAPLRHPFTYADDGYPDLWEFPVCGWHENLLKGHNQQDPLLLLLFPIRFPEAVPTTFVKTPEEEFQYNSKPFLERALREGFPVVNLAWHPWSLRKLDPDMKMVEMTINYAIQLGFSICSFGEVWRTYFTKKESS